MPAGAPSPSLLLLTEARRGRTSTFFCCCCSAVSKKKTSRLYLESRGSQPPDRYVQGRSQPCISSRNKGLKYDPQIFREMEAFAGGLSLLTQTFKCLWRIMGNSPLVRKGMVLEKDPLEHRYSRAVWWRQGLEDSRVVSIHLLIPVQGGRELSPCSTDKVPGPQQRF